MKDRLENYTWQGEEGNEKTAANWTRASNLLPKVSAIGLEVADSGPVSCRFFIPFFSLPCVVL